MSRRLPVIAFAIFLTLATAQTAFAQGSGDRVVMNDRYVLHSGETHSGDLTVMAREVELQPGSQVNGDLSIISAGNVVLGGEIDGNVSILSPSARLDNTLRLTGNLSICSRDIQQAPGVTITGNQSTGCNQLGAVFSGVRRGGGFPQIGSAIASEFNGNPILRFFRVIVTAFALAALAALAAVVFPRQINRMTETAMSKFATTTIVGFVSAVVVIAVTALYLLSLIVTLGLACLASPLVALAWLVVLVALVTGWIAVSIPLGTILLRRFKVYPTPMVSAALGALVLTLVQGLLEMIPCVGWLAWLMLIVLGSAGFGSVLLTRFGTRPYPEIVPVRSRPEIV